MTSYLPDNNFHSIGNSPISQIRQAEDVLLFNAKIAHTQDTILAAQKTSKKQQVKAGQRASLPTPGKSKNPNFFVAFGEALSKAFTVAAQGANDAEEGFRNLIKLDGSMSAAVLASTKNAIAKQQTALKCNADFQAHQAGNATTNAIAGTVLTYLGIGLIAVTVVSGLFDFGLSEAALPEEIGVVEGLAEGGDFEMGDMALTVVDDNTDLAMPEPVSSDEDSGIAEITENTGTIDERSALKKSWDALSKGVKDLVKTKPYKILKLSGRKTLSLGATSCFSAPSLMQFLQSGTTAAMLRDTAVAQQDVGTATAAMQECKIDFSFCQQLLKREGGALRMEADGASQIVETFGNGATAYQQIGYGLANAV